MNKLTLFGSLALLIALINCQYDETCGKDLVSVPEGYDEEYCLFLSPETGLTHCCYIDGGNNEGKCIGLTDDEYENIVRFKKYYRDHNSDEDFGLDCSSKFISLSLFAVLALLF